MQFSSVLALCTRLNFCCRGRARLISRHSVCACCLALRITTDLLPSRNLRFSGVCQLNITQDSLHLQEISDAMRQLVYWPVASIRHCGYHRKLLILNTAESVVHLLIIVFAIKRVGGVTEGAGLIVKLWV